MHADRNLNFDWTQRHCLRLLGWRAIVVAADAVVNIAAAAIVVVAIITIEWIQWHFTKKGCSKGQFNVFSLWLCVQVDTKYDCSRQTWLSLYGQIRWTNLCFPFYRRNSKALKVWKTMIALYRISFKYQLDMLFSFNVISNCCFFFRFAVAVRLSTFSHQTLEKPKNS